MAKITTTLWTHLRDRDHESIKEILAQLSVIEILEVLSDFTIEDAVIIFRMLDKDTALMVFESLETDLQHTLVDSFNEEQVVNYISELAPDDRVALLDEMPAKVAKKILDSIPADKRKETDLILGYETETAGRIMTTEYISFPQKTTVKETVREIIKIGREKETIYNIYVTDETRKLVGVLSLRDLFFANEASDGAQLAEVMTSPVISVTTSCDQEEAAQLLQT